MDGSCKCKTVKQYEANTWQCMVCRRKFVPVDQIQEAGEQKPVLPVTNIEFASMQVSKGS